MESTSRAMAWNPLEPESWADTLGLAAVPMFAADNGATASSTVWVMLDGKRASFSLSIPQNQSHGVQDELNWSWSAHVRHVLRVDPASKSIAVARWDIPGNIAHFAWPSGKRSAVELLLMLQASPAPRGPDCVSYVLDVFRSLRARCADANISLAILNCLLLALREFRKKGDLPTENGGRLTPQAIVNWLTTICPQDVPQIGLSSSSAPSNIDIKDLLDHMARPEPVTGCVLFPHILLRHASSYLYQEAHLQIERDSQRFLFEEMASAIMVAGTGPRDARYTPPNLARALARETIRLIDSDSKNIIVLDPACGSGVFLQEFVREALHLGYRAFSKLIGYDISQLAKAIAPFATQLTSEECAGSVAPFEFKHHDSLDAEWDPADIILMNPPFRSWQDMSLETQAKVLDTLGTLATGRPDLAAAFLWKACQHVSPGGVIACVLPAPLLQSSSLENLRAAIASQFQISLVGRFHGYSYFASSLVETSFLILKKSDPQADAVTRILIASERNEDNAIRRLRGGEILSGDGGKDEFVEFFAVSPDLLTPASWLPRRQADFELLRLLSQSQLPTVQRLFTIHQGVRTGHNEAFLLSIQELNTLPVSEQAYFRPTAGQGAISDGKLSTKEYIFYPFAPSGAVFETENELRRKLPKYFKRWLEPNRHKLESRAKISSWCLPTWPRTWQFERQRKIVTSYFGGRGSYALDLTGDHVVVAGFAWFWKGELDADTQLGHNQACSPSLAA